MLDTVPAAKVAFHRYWGLRAEVSEHRENVFGFSGCFCGGCMRSRGAGGGTTVFETAPAPAATGRIDKLVFAQLARLNIQPVLCSDAVFVRRAYLDVIGTLPTAKEARDFIRGPGYG